LKKNVYEAEERPRELDAVMGALAHRSRRQILLVVHFRGGAVTAGEIAERFSCAWPTVSRHLRVLERAELLVHEKQGRQRIYRVNPAKFHPLKEWLSWFDRRRTRS
jgi:DNA-binding transcriptional ArsR family regulator